MVAFHVSTFILLLHYAVAFLFSYMLNEAMFFGIIDTGRLKDSGL